VLPDYVFYFTKSKYYTDFVTSTQRVVAQPNINAQEYGDLKILLPPIAKQHEFESIVKQSDKSKLKLQNSLAGLSAIKIYI
jgi:type I restriction enzyme S subunit